ncbi:MAG: hypothetical protein H3C34_19245 [Caldilineaceae bacterium]|nr:hypothetical protein [Caldilineaceae bacterium]
MAIYVGLKSRAIGAVLIVWLLAACGTPTPVPLQFGAAPWQPGETHAYQVTDVNGNYAGTATFAISDGTNDKGERLWLLEREINAQGDHENIQVKMGDGGFRPQSAYLERSDAAGTESVDAAYDGPEVNLVLTSKADVMSTQRVEVPSDVRDTATLPMIIRALPLARGYATQINAFLPIAGLLDRVTVRVVSEEDVTVPAGTFKSWLVELDTGDAQSKAWVVKTTPFQLAKYYDGRNKATYELQQYTPGTAP